MRSAGVKAHVKQEIQKLVAKKYLQKLIDCKTGVYFSFNFGS